MWLWLGQQLQQLAGRPRYGRRVCQPKTARHSGTSILQRNATAKVSHALSTHQSTFALNRKFVIIPLPQKLVRRNALMWGRSHVPKTARLITNPAGRVCARAGRRVRMERVRLYRKKDIAAGIAVADIVVHRILVTGGVNKLMEKVAIADV